MMDQYLFPIPLMGIGSTEVESLSSYIHRTSIIHGLSVGSLIRYAHGCFDLIKASETDISYFPKYISVDQLIRSNKITKKVVDAFELLTGQNLIQGTLLFMENNISCPIDEVAHGFRWCPECIEEMNDRGVKPYFKLVWHMAGVKYCHIHKTKLVSFCSNCMKEQNSYVRNYRFGRCWHCGEKLSSRPISINHGQEPDSIFRNEHDLVELISESAQANGEILNFGIGKSLEHIYMQCLKGGNQDELYKFISQEKISDVIRDKKKLSLKLIRRLSYFSGIAIYTLMKGDAEKVGAFLGLGVSDNYLPETIKPKKKIKNDHQAIFKRIKSVIAKSEKPISLKSLAKKSGVSIGYIEYRYKHIAKFVSKSFKENHDREMLQKRYKAQIAAFKFFADNKYMGLRSRKLAYKVLREETGLPKFTLKKAIDLAYRISVYKGNMY